jgi:hypothetical protein
MPNVEQNVFVMVIKLFCKFLFIIFESLQSSQICKESNPFFDGYTLKTVC